MAVLRDPDDLPSARSPVWLGHGGLWSCVGAQDLQGGFSLAWGFIYFLLLIILLFIHIFEVV